MDPFAKRRIGTTNVEVSVLGLGGTAYAGMYTSVTDDEAADAILGAYRKGIRYFDTAPLYGHGNSERRLGHSLRGLDRKTYVVSTKVGRVLEAEGATAVEPDIFASSLPYRPVFDFTRNGVFRAFEASLERLHTDFVDICFVHDPDHSGDVILEDPDHEAHFKEVMLETVPAIVDLRTHGKVVALGVGMNQCRMLQDFVETGTFDCILLAGRYTLLDQSALNELLPACVRQGVSVIIGGPYNSGILATGPVPDAKYNYQPASEEVLARVRRLSSVCREFSVDLRAAALQFPLAHPATASVIPGARSVYEVEENVRLIEEPIPDEFWLELKRHELIHADSPIPHQ